MKTQYTKEEIEKILKENDFEYQRVELPYGLSTPGQDRSVTRDIIFPESLYGKSVLDVGSANGYFCFQAESKGASKIVGIELKKKRFEHANLLKSINGSEVEFLRKDIIESPLNEEFDYVLFLNVIHHLKEPMHALRKLAAITKEKLIFEFPTFEDPKFRRHISIFMPYIFNRLPLIGVSSLSDRKVDQTFIFSPPAIRKILIDHEMFFSKINIVRSPMGEGRRIAICMK